MFPKKTKIQQLVHTLFYLCHRLDVKSTEIDRENTIPQGRQGKP